MGMPPASTPATTPTLPWLSPMGQARVDTQSTPQAAAPLIASPCPFFDVRLKDGKNRAGSQKPIPTGTRFTEGSSIRSRSKAVKANQPQYSPVPMAPSSSAPPQPLHQVPWDKDSSIGFPSSNAIDMWAGYAPRQDDPASRGGLWQTRAKSRRAMSMAPILGRLSRPGGPRTRSWSALSSALIRRTGPRQRPRCHGSPGIRRAARSSAPWH